jgi:glycosyltransferase involved in cell wall biosynthesis
MPETVLLNASFGPSLTRFRGRLIQAMVAGGHEVHVSAPDIDQELAQALRDLGAEPHIAPLARTGLSPLADLIYFRRIRRLLRQTGATLCLSYTIKPNIWASLAARSLGVRAISMVTGLGYAFVENPGQRHKVVQWIARRLYRAATNGNQLVIFQNPDDPTDFIDDGCLADPDKVRVVNGSGVDLGYYAVAALPEQPVFLMICRLIVAKGVHEYVAAAARVRASGRNARFLLAGPIDPGPGSVGSEELRRWQAEGIEYLGALDDVRPAIARASVFVLPSYYREGVPRSTLEAMAMGRAIVTTDMPGCRETVVDGVNGFLVAPRDVDAVTVAMQRLIDAPELIKRMGERSSALCLSKFDVELVNREMLRHLSLD